ncbi:hypothetical protein BGZ65_010856 [Modicella reniformis]|uniref:NodB homology domain-containing protein n=1 Tax=Modicella reniformis TaxID=1440133 RepID=A0A9P6MKC1_9FUNG|nr:hypothetical protein BGZ65_010856 [Modicella reniformis]
MHFTISLAAAVSALLVTGLTGTDAAACDAAKCVFPACICPSVNPPNGMLPKTVPQFFTLTFDDAIQAQTVPVAASIMSKVKQWYAAGNEVADHTMNHLGTPPADEINGNRKAINAFAGVPFAKMTGFRAPFLNYSKETFDVLAQEKFLYDSSTSAIPGNAYWPYTLDYGLANDCWTGICDKNVVEPGMWEIPMHAIMDNSEPAKALSMDPQLSGTKEVVTGWLKDNFNRHYQGTRQPFGIFLHPIQVKDASLFNDFFTWASTQEDVCMPAVGKEICNGLDDTNSGGIDKGVLEVCNFNSGPWSTCYGCPKTSPTPADPVPERVAAAGVTGTRTPVPANCAMEWWDPIAAQCLCASANCTFTDVALTTTKPSTSVPTTGNNNNKPSAAGQLSSWTGMGLVAVVAAGLQMF